MPGSAILNGPEGTKLHDNTRSLRFVNAALPGNLNTRAGGEVQIADNDPLTRPRDFTAEAFIKIDRRVNWPTIMGKVRSGGTSWELDLNNDGTFRVRIDTPAQFNQGFFTTTNLENSAWHHVALTYDDNTRAADLYVDYVRRGGGRVTGQVAYDTGLLLIGDESGGRAFDGWIDEVRLSDYVRHPDEFLRAIVPKTGTVFVVR